MKSLNAVLILMFVTSAVSFAAAIPGAAQAKNKGKSLSGIGTVHSFDDQVVGGKYQYPDEAVATVEDEKVLNDLLAVRKDFKDRLQSSAAKH